MGAPIVHVYIYSVAKLAVARVFSRIDFQWFFYLELLALEVPIFPKKRKLPPIFIDRSVKLVLGNRLRPSPKSIRQKLRSLESNQIVSVLVTPNDGRTVLLARKTKLIRAIASNEWI